MTSRKVFDAIEAKDWNKVKELISTTSWTPQALEEKHGVRTEIAFLGSYDIPSDDKPNSKCNNVICLAAVFLFSIFLISGFLAVWFTCSSSVHTPYPPHATYRRTLHFVF